MSDKPKGYIHGVSVGPVYVRTREWGRLPLEDAIKKGWVGSVEGPYEKQIRATILAYQGRLRDGEV